MAGHDRRHEHGKLAKVHGDLVVALGRCAMLLLVARAQASVDAPMYGRTYWGALRATFIIGPDGVVAHVIPRVTPRTHDDEVLAVLEQLAAA
jgi:peroxiredoxin